MTRDKESQRFNCARMEPVAGYRLADETARMLRQLRPVAQEAH